jgi:hypothetical protein
MESAKTRRKRRVCQESTTLIELLEEADRGERHVIPTKGRRSTATSDHVEAGADLLHGIAGDLHLLISASTLSAVIPLIGTSKAAGASFPVTGCAGSRKRKRLPSNSLGVNYSGRSQTAESLLPSGSRT